jgi:SHS2 domain-containing protein
LSGMEHEILEGISRADIAFRVRGDSPEELFAAGARALVEIMLEDPGTLRPSVPVSFSCQADELDLLYFDFLSELIYYKDSEKLLLVPERLLISSSPGGFSLSCNMRGETIDRTRHFFGMDIKAVTLHHLLVEQRDGSWSATAVVDV